MFLKKLIINLSWLKLKALRILVLTLPIILWNFMYMGYVAAQTSSTPPSRANRPQISSINLKNNQGNFKASNIEYNFKDDIFLASGNVQFESENELFRADKLFYNPKNDIIYAEGNVVYTTADGNTLYADNLTLDSALTFAIINEIKLIFNDESSLNAQILAKNSANIYNLKEASYTSCQIVNSIIPTWRINAHRGSYNSETNTVSFYNTWVQLKSVPIFWVPYLRFSNLSSKRAAGFLTPSYGNNSILGGSLILPLYLPIGESQDMLINTHIFSKVSPLVVVDYKGYFHNIEFKMNASYNNIKGNYQFNNKNRNFRGHYFLNAKTNMTDIWRASLKIEQASGDNYLNLYNINPKDSKESFYANTLNLEGFFNNNNYTNLQIYTYKEINNNFITKSLYNSGSVWNYRYFMDYSDFGSLNLSTSAANFYHTSKDNIYRIYVNTDYRWFQPTSTGNYTLNSIFQNVYYLSIKSNPILNDNTYSAFGVSTTWEYPVFYNLKSYSTSVSPVLQLAYSSYLDKNKNNSAFDSSSINITSSNMLNLNHYDGYDKFEETKSFKYGLQASLLGDYSQGSRLFIGQIINFNPSSVNNLKLTANNLQLPLDERVLEKKTSIQRSNYFVSLDIYPNQHLLFSYEAILSANLVPISSDTTLALNNSLMGASLTHSFYNQLDANIYNFTKIAELAASSYIKISQNFNFNIISLFDLSKASEAKIKEINLLLQWSSNCLTLSFYTKKDFYKVRTGNTYGIMINIKNITDYTIKLN
ncbi:LPS-assembly protein LptD domain protein [Candidatus Hepatincolaceae symbiont of Richtersius coronifer]